MRSRETWCPLGVGRRRPPLRIAGKLALSTIVVFESAVSCRQSFCLSSFLDCMQVRLPERRECSRLGGEPLAVVAGPNRRVRARARGGVGTVLAQTAARAHPRTRGVARPRLRNQRPVAAAREHRGRRSRRLELAIGLDGAERRPAFRSNARHVRGLRRIALHRGDVIERKD